MTRLTHPEHQTLLFGVDFTSAPRRAKPITVAVARAPAMSASAGTPPDAPLVLEALLRFESLQDWQDWLGTPGPWVGGFDFPFGLPRALVDHLGWVQAPSPSSCPWVQVTRRLAAISRAELVALCRAWCDAHPPGRKFAHRATDLIAGSSPSMKWVNPPVALMLHVGAPALMHAGITVPGLSAVDTDPMRIALEAYPGLAARALIGRRSYKSDDPARRQCTERRDARRLIIDALQSGAPPFSRALDLRGWAETCLDDAGADLLDAVLCLTQAHRAWEAGAPHWGIPPAVDPVEGWIVGV
jgi:hypothetical protein